MHSKAGDAIAGVHFPAFVSGNADSATWFCAHTPAGNLGHHMEDCGQGQLPLELQAFAQ